MPDWLQPASPSLFAAGTSDDPRLGSRVAQIALDFMGKARPEVVLLGVPDDRGVIAGGGRAGAAEGPDELRRHLYKLTPGMHGQLDRLRVADLGNIVPAGSAEETHERVREAVFEVNRAGAAAVVIGGGHDHAFGSVSGALLALGQKPLLVVNVDTHLDVRPLREGAIVTSGTPFRRLLEAHGPRIRLCEVAVQPQHNAADHLAWAEKQGAQIFPLSLVRSVGGADQQVRILLAERPATPAAVSLDLDCAAAHVAPGVSAPPADGLTATEVLEIGRAAGKHPGTRLLDVMELAPRLDQDGRTARLAAAAVWQFLAGVATRPV